jgi:hypothetical protein
VTTALVAIVVAILVSTFGATAYRAYIQRDFSSSGSTSFSTAAAASSTPAVLQLNPDGTTLIRGWADGSGMPGGDDPASTIPTATVGNFGVAIPTIHDDIPAYYRVQVYVSKQTKVLRDGKPWDPPGDSKLSPAERLLSEEFPDTPSDAEPGTSTLESHELTINAHKHFTQLVADTIDIDTKSGSAPQDVY